MTCRVAFLGLAALLCPSPAFPQPAKKAPTKSTPRLKKQPEARCFQDLPQSGIYELELTSVPGGESFSKDGVPQCSKFPTGTKFDLRVEVDLTGDAEQISTISKGGTIRNFRYVRGVLPGCKEQGVTDERIIGISWIEYGTRKEGEEAAWIYHLGAMRMQDGHKYLEINGMLVDRRDRILCYHRLNSE